MLYARFVFAVVCLWIITFCVECPLCIQYIHSMHRITATHSQIGGLLCNRNPYSQTIVLVKNSVMTLTKQQHTKNTQQARCKTQPNENQIFQQYLFNLYVCKDTFGMFGGICRQVFAAFSRRFLCSLVELHIFISLQMFFTVCSCILHFSETCHYFNISYTDSHTECHKRMHTRE